MMRSMFSGVTGLRTHQSRMDIIAHNIANVNTTGFKSSRMTFADAFSQTIQGATGPNPDTGRGGQNPMQIGLGVNMSTISRMMTPGAAQTTGDPFHLMIQDDGFFVVGDAIGGVFFTRAGDFDRDEDWNIKNPAGLLLQGWPAGWDPNGGPARDTVTREPIGPMRGPVQGIQITPAMRSVPPRATGTVAATGNLRSTDSPIASTMNFQDSLGNNYSMNIRYVFVPGATPAAAHWVVQRQDVFTRTSDNETFSFDGGFASPAAAGGWTTLTAFSFNQNGYPIVTGAAPTAVAPLGPVNATAAGAPTGADAAGFITFMNMPPAAFADAPPLRPNQYFGQSGVSGTAITGVPSSIRLDFSGLTQFADVTNATTRNVDGLGAGTLIGLSIGGDGIISGTYSNGQSFELWQIALARFDNPGGLAAMGGNLFSATANSGAFDMIGLTPGAAGTQILGGTLEMSNVDLAAEFTEMITTQRGFQANSRIISTSDEMLQELVNLRR